MPYPSAWAEIHCLPPGLILETALGNGHSNQVRLGQLM